MNEIISKITGFEIAKYRFVLQPKEDIILPQYKGATFRGGFGHAFRLAACTVRNMECKECLLMSRCVYSYVFETPTPPDSKVLSKSSHVPHPFVLEPPLEDKRIYGKNEALAFSLVLIGRAIEYLPYFVYAVEELGRMGIGKSRGKYNLIEVIGLGINGEVKVFSERERRFLNSGPKITPDKIMIGRNERIEKIEIRFLSPARFVYEEKLTEDIEFHILLRSLLRRLSSLMYFHCGKRLDMDFRDVIEKAGTIRIVENGLVWKDWMRHSSRQDSWRVSGGVVGSISYQGPLQDFLPLLWLGEYIHIGKQTSFGLGQLRVGIN